MISPPLTSSPFLVKRSPAGIALAGLLAFLPIAVALAVAPNVPLEPFKARVIEILAIPILLLGIRHFRSALDWPIVLLAASWYAATIASLAPYSSVFGAQWRGRGLLLWMACAVVYLAAASHNRRCGPQERNLGVLWGIVASGAAVALIAALQAFGHDPLPWYHQGSIDATLGNQSFVRDWLAPIAVLIVCVRFPKLPRSVWLVPAAAFLVWTAGARWQSVEYRLSMWGAIVPALPRVPLFGYGPETGILIVDAIAHSSVKDTDLAQDRTENLELDTWLERGGFGLGAELLFWGMVLIRGRRTVYALPLMVCLGLAQISVMSVPSQLLAYLLAGLAVGGSRIDTADTQPPRPCGSRSVTISLPLHLWQAGAAQLKLISLAM